MAGQAVNAEPKRGEGTKPNFYLILLLKNETERFSKHGSSQVLKIIDFNLLVKFGDSQQWLTIIAS